MDVAAIVDGAVTRPVVVFGSLPPEGRDLDVLARSTERTAIEAALTQAGFERRRTEWARFSGTAVDVVDVVPAEDWGLPQPELSALFDEAVPLEGRENVVRPAPHHSLLILSRRVVRDGALPDKRRRRVTAALDEDPDAWTAADRRAASWGARGALSALKRSYETGVPIVATARAGALREELEARGIRGGRAAASAWRRIARRPQRGHVVTFSGLDGSGKSTQAELLRAALERLGHDPVVEWTKIARSSWLKALSKPVQAAMRLRRRSHEPVAERTIMTGDGPVVLAAEQAAARELREKSRLLTHAWTVLVALGNGWDHRRATVRHLRAGRIVISDRYTLDTAAHLRYRYGVDESFRFQMVVNRSVSPSPSKSFFLDVSPEAAYARKAEQYQVGDLALLRRLYLEEAARAEVCVLPGEDPLDTVSERIVRAVWEAVTPR